MCERAGKGDCVCERAVANGKGEDGRGIKECEEGRRRRGIRASERAEKGFGVDGGEAGRGIWHGSGVDGRDGGRGIKAGEGGGVSGCGFWRFGSGDG